MAITIDNMQVEAMDRAAQTPQPSEGLPSQAPANMRRELTIHAERELRLRAD